MKLIISLAGLILAVTAIAPAGPPSSPAPQLQPQPLTIQKIRGNVYFAMGGAGANCGFVVGDKDVLVIDSKMTADSSRQMLAEIGKITPLPVRTLALTHSDADHVNGLGAFPAGLKIYGHARTKKDMEEAFGKDAALKPLLAYLPNEIVADTLEFKLGADTVRLLYFGPAHTSGDMVVYLPAEKTAFVGDLLFVGRDPLIHRQKGGNSFGLVKNLKGLLALDADTYLSGHAAPLKKADIETLVKSIEEKQAKVQTLLKEGKSFDEIKKAFGITDQPGPGGMRWPSLVEVIFQELTEKK
jgi:cyclase